MSDFTFRMTENKCYELIEYKGRDRDVIIPSVYKNKPVTRIGRPAFKDLSYIQSIEIPEGIEQIDTWSFGNLSKLTSITIPSTVKSLGYGQFDGCTNLKNVIIKPGKMESFNLALAFNKCSNLTNISIPDNVKRVENTSISKKEYPNLNIENYSGLGYIGKWLFKVYTSNPDSTVNRKCKESYTVKEGTRWISNSAFSSCKDLVSVSMPDSVIYIGSGTFGFCDNLKKIIIPKQIKTIYGFTFYDCKNLEEVYLPKGLEKIEKDAFKGCKRIKVVNYGGSQEEWSKIKPKLFSGNCSLNKANINFNC